MAKYEVIMPKMGESVQEATITKWFKKTGDKIQEDDVLFEIATDKVDSEIPSPVEGILEQCFFKENDVVAVGEIIAIINLGEDINELEDQSISKNKTVTSTFADNKDLIKPNKDLKKSSMFFSPLVKNIATKENISSDELNAIKGSGYNNRVSKKDILEYIKIRTHGSAINKNSDALSSAKNNVLLYPGDEVIEMDRMRKLIAEHMVMSKQISPHVTNFIEVDVTNVVLWREKIKEDFLKKEKQNLTYLPLIIESVAKILKEFPGINASVSDNKIIYRKNINIGIAVALPSGNLIVPVIKNADQKSLIGITVEMNKLVENARINKLSPDDIKEGTFSISNFGTFKNLTGTPIINQPQVAILATGNIEKKPAVLETAFGDVIAIRHKMMLSLSYDHRVVDGAMGGSFLYRLKLLLEAFDIKRNI